MAAQDSRMLPTNPNFEDAEYDFPVPTAPQQLYMIASTPRSGGTYLAQTFWRTGIMGAPHEYFGFYGTLLRIAARLKPFSLKEYMEDLLPRRTSANGVFGVKVHFDHLQFMILSGILSQLKNLRVISLERSDPIDQAVSHARALQTEQWNSLEEPKTTTPAYNPDLIRWSLNHIKEQQRGWQTFFEQHNLSPLRVNYDEFVADPAAVTKTAQTSLQIPTAPVSPVNLPNISKQSDNLNLEWAERFRREAADKGGLQP